MNIESCITTLAHIGVKLEGQLPQLTILALCKKASWDQPMRFELGWIDQKGVCFDVVFTNLPYVLGPRWREISGGKPVLITCNGVEELTELLSSTFSPRMVNGVLHVT